jgi:hypothetical protein
VSVRLGNGDGTFAPPRYSPSGGGTSRPQIGDLNNDGRPDLITANAGGLIPLLGNGDGTFQSPSPPLALPQVSGNSQTLSSFHLGDLNNDGRLDLLAAGHRYSLQYYGLYGVISVRTNYANVFLGDGGGAFEHAATSTFGSSDSISDVADFNSDGRLDLLMGGSSSGLYGSFSTTTLRLGNGDGTFQSDSLAAIGVPGADAVADLNHDGHLDFAGSSGYYNESVTVVLGNGDGSFQSPIIYQGTVDRRSLFLAAADLDGDHKLDLVTTSSDKDVSVLLGSGDGSFQSPQFFPAGSSSGLVGVSDLDGNGFPDLVALLREDSGAATSIARFNDGVWGPGDPPPPPAPPSVTISNATVTEGDTGTADAVLTVSLSHPGNNAVSVEYKPMYGTATPGIDYTVAAGLLVFATGETSTTFSVAIHGDAAVEPDETVVVQLFYPVGAIVADGYGVVTIVNDDAAPPPPLQPSLTISDVSKKEGRKGTISFTFTVTLSAPSAVGVTVSYATADGTAKASGGDYIAASGTLTFAPGQTSKTITIRIKGDRTKEADESFFLNLLAATGADIEDGQGLGTIVNDD